MRASKMSITSQRTKIAVIDDDIFIREAWGLLGHEFDTLTFESPEEFLDYLAQIPNLAVSFDVIVTDYNFGMRSAMSGADFAERLRQLVSTPIILSTDMDQSSIRRGDLFDSFLDKKIINWRKLDDLLQILKQS